MKELETVAKIYAESFDGNAWYGKNIFKTLRDVPPEKLMLRLHDSYNIVELVYHMLAWRTYVAQVLEFDTLYDVTPEFNFPKVDEINREDWEQLLCRVKESQGKLEELIRTFGNNLDQKGPMKQASYRDIIYGVIHHDIYHTGQINFLIKYA